MEKTNGIHINRPSSTRILYRIRYPRGRKFDLKYHRSKESAIQRVLKEMKNNKNLQFVEIYRQILADYYDPVLDLVCRINNI